MGPIIHQYAEEAELWMALTVHSWAIIAAIGVALTRFFGRELTMKELLFVAVEIPKSVLASAWAGFFVGYPTNLVARLIFGGGTIAHWALIVGWIAGSIAMMARSLWVLRWDLNRDRSGLF